MQKCTSSEDFAWVSLYKNAQIADNFENKVWECYSVPYRHAKKNILKSKPNESDDEENIPLKVVKEGLGAMFGESPIGDRTRIKKHLHKERIAPRNHTDDSNMDESDYEDNIHLKVVKEGLSAMFGESPIGGRTRIKRHLHKERVIKCETQRELWDLEDYEAIAPKSEHELITKPEYRSLGVQPFFFQLVTKSRFVKYKLQHYLIKIKTLLKGKKWLKVQKLAHPKIIMYF